jgi:hypothetical protein
MATGGWQVASEGLQLDGFTETRYRDQNDVDRSKCTTFLIEVYSICQSLSGRNAGSVCRRSKVAKKDSAQNLARIEFEIVNAYMRSPKQARSNGRFNARALGGEAPGQGPCHILKTHLWA